MSKTVITVERASNGCILTYADVVLIGTSLEMVMKQLEAMNIEGELDITVADFVIPELEAGQLSFTKVGAGCKLFVPGTSYVFPVMDRFYETISNILTTRIATYTENVAYQFEIPVIEIEE